LLLTATAHKLGLIRKLAVDAVLLINFTPEFAALTGEEFLRQAAEPGNQLREICVGTRFHFGHDRAGNVRLMEKLAPTLGFTVKEIQSVHTGDGEMISSSAVRQLVLCGQLDRAAAMLGRPYSLLGTVEPGDHRGRSLGFPTANLNPHNEVLPPDGVYAARVLAGNERFLGVVNVGLRPTFQHATPGRLIEVHILDVDRDFYGQEIEVVLIQKLRGEQKFASAAALVEQIRADVATTRQLLRTA
jgi:riboflavin kinase/FMN adenylyltransferase